MDFRTDLAMERTEIHRDNLPEGITNQDYTKGGLSINKVVVENKQAAELIGKPEGCYITIQSLPFYSHTMVTDEEIIFIAQEIESLLPSGEDMVLVVGLGNHDITPDAIGPLAAHQILATRHLASEQIGEENGLEDLRPVAVLAPGVLGQTGIETSEIIHSIVQDIKPCLVIVIDALASKSTKRLGSTIQISNSGISPGSGVLNKRRELSKATLGIDVISIGVPTVVDAATLSYDLLGGKEGSEELFEPEGRAMMVTPREIDLLIEHAARVVALAINKALQSKISLQDLVYLTS